MGRTIPSYRIASEIEILKWRPFRHALDKQDRKVFDEMLPIAHLYTIAGTMACRPILSHVIPMSIIFEHYRILTEFITEHGSDFDSVNFKNVLIVHSKPLKRTILKVKIW